MSKPIVYGPAFSTYVRSARLTLEEKGVEHTLHDVDFVHGAHKEAPHIERHPFGKVPAFEHDGHAFYECSAIMRYVDEVFDGPSLTPATALGRARMNQVLSIVDAYGYQPVVGGLFIQRVFLPMLGAQTDVQKIEEAKAPATLFTQQLEKLLGSSPFFTGEQLTLADLHAFPVLTYLDATPEGKEILEKTPKVRQWMSRMASRDSVKKVMPANS